MKKGKVGILTFQSAVNYGAVLQAYALQKIINDNKVEVDIINYENDLIKKQYRIKFYNGTRRNFILDIIKTIFINGFYVFKKIKFNKFINQFMVLSSKKYNKKNIAEAKNTYDTIVIGSDQVWNSKLTNFDTTFLGDFIEKKRVFSYAASFGFGEIPVSQKSIYFNLLSDFNAISVREISGQKIIKNLLNVDCRLDLDPTLLLRKDDWDKVASKIHKKKYILVYTVAESKQLIEYVEKLMNKTNYEVIYITSSLKKTNSRFKYVRTASPREFVSYIKNASIVVTTSFHATVFSITFQRRFAVELRNLEGHINYRIIDLLKLLDIYDGPLEAILDIKGVDWQNVDVKLSELRKESVQYLKSII